MTTLVLGDSIIYHTGKAEVQLHGGGVTVWSGIHGSRIANMAKRVEDYLQKNDFPTTIIIALGSNDIFRSPVGHVKLQLIQELKSIRNLLPHTRLIWSDILPRVKYENELKKGAGKRFTIDLNKNARGALREFSNTHVIRNAHIFKPQEHALFCDDIHLSDVGKDTFRTHLSDALLFFNHCPSVFQYPEDVSNQ